LLEDSLLARDQLSVFKAAVTKKTTGAVPCAGVLYQEFPTDGPSGDWASTTCNVTVTKRPVFTQSHPPGILLLYRLRARFDATVTPMSGQGGPDLAIRGKFVSAPGRCGSD
jgi:hypothetical protein